MSRRRSQIYDQVMAAAVAAEWLRQDQHKLPEEKARGAFATDEAAWLIYMRDALISLHCFIERHSTDPETRNLADVTIGPLRKYLDHRMQAPGIKRRFEVLREQFARDGARHDLVKEIEAMGYTKTEACGMAADLLADHPLGMSEAGEQVDDSTIEKSVTRWEQSGLPDEIWRLPGGEPMPPIPDPAEHITPKP